MPYKSKIERKWIISRLIILVGLLCIALLLSFTPQSLVSWVLVGITVLHGIILLWQWRHTYYKLDDRELSYYAGPRWGKVEIQKIYSISKARRIGDYNNASRAFNGLLLKYQFGEIFISPAATDVFLSAVRSVKPSIKINAS